MTKREDDLTVYDGSGWAAIDQFKKHVAPPGKTKVEDIGGAAPPSERKLELSHTTVEDLRAATLFGHDTSAWRVLGCLCYRQQAFSVTARRLPSTHEGLKEWFPRPPIEPKLPGTKPLPVWPKKPLTPADDVTDLPSAVSPKDFFRWQCARESAALVAKAISGEHEPFAGGLVVVAGGTGSGKSTLASALTLEALNRRRAHSTSEERTPHIVTFEDPIESWFAPDWLTAQLLGFDYTPREKGVDAVDLEQVVMDALRQTPAILYVGETREHDDWRHILHFAGTGHTAITTTHAGTLRESMDTVLKAQNARTPAARADAARRLLGVVHVRVSNSMFFLPALWRRTARSIAALTAEGLGSILPGSAYDRDSGSWGRAYFASALYGPKGVIRKYARAIASANTDQSKFARSLLDALDEHYAAVELEAMRWDLNGE